MHRSCFPAGLEALAQWRAGCPLPPIWCLSILNRLGKKRAIFGVGNVGIPYTFSLLKTARTSSFPHRSPTLVPPNTLRASPVAVLEVLGGSKALWLKSIVSELSIHKTRLRILMAGTAQGQ